MGWLYLIEALIMFFYIKENTLEVPIQNVIGIVFAFMLFNAIIRRIFNRDKAKEKKPILWTILGGLMVAVIIGVLYGICGALFAWW